MPSSVVCLAYAASLKHSTLFPHLLARYDESLGSGSLFEGADEDEQEEGDDQGGGDGGMAGECVGLCV